jgi:transposase, IS30 family
MARGYHHVTRDQRCQIYALKTRGCSLNIIAEHIGCHVSSISREIKRNSGRRGYRIKQADAKARKRRSLVSRLPKKMRWHLLRYIQEKLQMEWSPQQISGRLKQEGKSISHESIYQYVWANKRLGGLLYKHLRHHGKKYNKRSSSQAGRGLIPGRVDISERPKIVEKKLRIGDFEGDTIVGARHQGAILSYVDRHSKFVWLQKLKNREASTVLAATKEQFTEMPHKIWSITFDNGKEFSKHEEIALFLNTNCYFAKPYRAWERGLNEHTNGLVRQYLPKSTDIKHVSTEFITQIEEKLNHRPRKVLNYKTPYEVFFGK